jgi:hypothetical protein
MKRFKFVLAIKLELFLVFEVISVLVPYRRELSSVFCVLKTFRSVQSLAMTLTLVWKIPFTFCA